MKPIIIVPILIVLLVGCTPNEKQERELLQKKIGALWAVHLGHGDRFSPVPETVTCEAIDTVNSVVTYKLIYYRKGFTFFDPDRYVTVKDNTVIDSWYE